MIFIFLTKISPACLHLMPEIRIFKIKLLIV